MNVWDRVSAVDHLFRGHVWSEVFLNGIPMELLEEDPYLSAADHGDLISEGHPFDITVAIGKYGTIVCQIVVFKDLEGFERYKRDGITIFDHKEI